MKWILMLFLALMALPLTFICYRIASYTRRRTQQYKMEFFYARFCANLSSFKHVLLYEG